MTKHEQLFVMNAEDNLRYLRDNGLDESVLKMMWENLSKYADACLKEYESFMKNISEERLTILYMTYIVEKREPHSCVYFIRNNDTGKYKIGVSNEPLTRLKQLKMQYHHMNMNMCDLELIAAIYAPKEEYQLEKYYHNLFQEYREEGEWFNIPQDKLKEIFSVNILENMKIKIKYNSGIFKHDGFKLICFKEIDKKNLMQFVIEDMCKKRFVVESGLNIDFFKKINELLNDLHGNHLVLFDALKTESFELFEWLSEDDLLESAKYGDIGFIEDYERVKKEILMKYFSEYVKQ